MQNNKPDLYQEWNIKVSDPQQRDILIARLSELGFDGFEEETGHLKACGIPETIDTTQADLLLRNAGLIYNIQEILPQNWNALWESSFEPVAIGDFCRIYAHFHPAETGHTYQICITPKMSFGTGHHATTRMMILMMEKRKFSGKKVLDFGAGTGVLAILAEKLGATTVLAIENDPGAAANTRENAVLNDCHLVEVKEGSLEISGNQSFDIILANINRNILLQYAAALSEKIVGGGELLLSGILAADVALLTEAFTRSAFQHAETMYEGNWACLRFIKTTRS